MRAMLLRNTRLIPSILFFLLGMMWIAYFRPSFLFDGKDGSIREFGVGNDKTIYSIGVVVVTMSVVLFYVFSMIDMMLK